MYCRIMCNSSIKFFTKLNFDTNLCLPEFELIFVPNCLEGGLHEIIQLIPRSHVYQHGLLDHRAKA